MGAATAHRHRRGHGRLEARVIGQQVAIQKLVHMRCRLPALT